MTLRTAVMTAADGALLFLFDSSLVGRALLLKLDNGLLTDNAAA
jgi:hypothetical protein